MISKKRSFKNSKLCVIVDGELLSPDELPQVARKAAAAGADMIQYREKSAATLDMIKRARSIKSALKNSGCVFLVNDRVEVALAAGADGVHVGNGDPDCKLVRAIDPGFIVGVSAANFIKAKAAKAQGADYIGAGPAFPTPIKPGKKTVTCTVLKRIEQLAIPVILIGGITKRNVQYLVRQGFRNIAVIRAVCTARDPYRATKKLKALLQK